MEKYPDLRVKFNWSAQELGIFLKCKLLEGYYDRQRRMSMIKESSLIRLIKFTNENLDNLKVNIDKPPA